MSPADTALARRTEAKPLAPVRDTRSAGWIVWLIPVVVVLFALALVGYFVMHR